jgi:hypothetical protein
VDPALNQPLKANLLLEQWKAGSGLLKLALDAQMGARRWPRVAEL